MSDAFIQIRPALSTDAPLGATLIHLSMGEEADWVFGRGNHKSTGAVLAGLFQRKGNRLSHELCSVAELDGRVVGALVACPGRRLGRLNLRTGLHLLQVVGLAATVRLVRYLPMYGNLVEAAADEFYVTNLAVLPEMQGRGIGAALLSHADALARSNRLLKCSLLVTFDNPARRLYERSGYQIVHSYKIEHPMIAHGSGGFHRMVKVLPPPAEIVGHA
ncbi:MAG: GNAT family N-acetyltransferase [Chloroflexi bacterium]|nr:GNAT family N-acetyltransferase [Chloroflexota bacterium]